MAIQKRKPIDLNFKAILLYRAAKILSSPSQHTTAAIKITVTKPYLDSAIAFYNFLYPDPIKTTMVLDKISFFVTFFM